jgi:predicted metal-binding protein
MTDAASPDPRPPAPADAAAPPGAPARAAPPARRGDPPAGADAATPAATTPDAAAPAGDNTAPRLYVCLTCKPTDHDPAAPRPGARLHAALRAALGREGAPAIRLVGVDCLSNCKRPCTVALGGPGRWTYVYGDLDPDAHAADILDGAARWAAAPEGLTPWRERPAIFRKNVIARVPPPPEPAR